ncbi:hypothetical protein GW17_00054125 [Ensete ventricosum]|nr:hypothetical protein GW17_00054125 [Ensete ventricosum]
MCWSDRGSVWVVCYAPILLFIARFAISTCTAQYGRYIPVRQVIGTRTARYRAIPLNIDHRLYQIQPMPVGWRGPDCSFSGDLCPGPRVDWYIPGGMYWLPGIYWSAWFLEQCYMRKAS